MTDTTNSIGAPLDSDELEDPSTNNDAPDPLLGEAARSGALSTIGSKTDQQSRVAAGRDAMGSLRSQYSAAAGQANEAYAAQRKTLQDATARLLAMQVGPTDKEQAFRTAAAWGTGDRAGRIDSGGINTAQANNLQAVREAEMQKQQLLTQYGMQIPQASLGAANQRLNQITQQMRIQQSENNSAAGQADKIVKPVNKYFMPNPADPNGAPVFNQALYDADIGAAKDKAKNAAALKVATQNAVAGNMDDATLTMLANNWKETGALPTGLTRGGPQIPLKIYARAKELADAAGDTNTSMLAGQAVRKANVANLTNLTKQFGAFSGFENTMLAVADNAKTLSAKVDRTNSPLLNQIFQGGQRQITGDSDLARFDLANNTLVSEYAKVMSGSMGNTPVSDAKAAEAHARLRTAMSNGTYAQVVDQLHQEAAMRNKALQDNITSVKQELGMLPKGPAAAAPAVAPTTALASKSPLATYYVALAKWQAGGQKGPKPVLQQ